MRSQRAAPRHRASRSRPGLPVCLSAALGVLAVAATAVCAETLDDAAHRQPTQATRALAARTLEARLRPAGETGAAPTLMRVSRDFARPALRAKSRPDSGTAAERRATRQRAAARDTALASVAQRAERYAIVLADDSWVLPTTHFHISTWFGEPGWYWSSGYHTGIDFVAACGTPEVAVAAGRVARAGWDGPYGYQVRLRLPNGDQVWYNHMIQIETHQGATLDQGGRIGLMGETGNAYGCHLHLEYRLHSNLKKPVDPAPYFAKHGIRLHALRPASAAKR